MSVLLHLQYLVKHFLFTGNDKMLGFRERALVAPAKSCIPPRFTQCERARARNIALSIHRHGR